MSPDVIAWTLALLAVAAPPASQHDCPPAASTALEQAADDSARGDFAAAAERLRLGYESAGTCNPLGLAAWAWRGWMAAMEAADRGGSPDALAPVRDAIAVVTALGEPRSEAGYAAALVSAAAAAAQDEREEMLVWIDEAHARSARLRLAGAPPRWPLTVDLAEGELWRGVHDYELAEAGFERAIAAGESPVAWRGLARTRDRRGNVTGACDAYRHVLRLLAADPAPGVLALEARGYLVNCAP